MWNGNPIPNLNEVELDGPKRLHWYSWPRQWSLWGRVLWALSMALSLFVLALATRVLVGCSIEHPPVAPVVEPREVEIQPLPPGTVIHIDTSDPDQMREWMLLGGTEPDPAAPTDERRRRAICDGMGGKYVGFFFDPIADDTAPICATPKPLRADKAVEMCEAMWEQRAKVFAMRGLMKRELRWRLLKFEGPVIWCMVGEGA